MAGAIEDTDREFGDCTVGRFGDLGEVISDWGIKINSGCISRDAAAVTRYKKYNKRHVVNGAAAPTAR